MKEKVEGSAHVVVNLQPVLSGVPFVDLVQGSISCNWIQAKFNNRKTVIR